MRPSTLLLSLAAVCAVIIPIEALAQDALPAQGDETLNQVQVSGQARRHRLDAYEARKVAGTYAMSNGWTLRVVPRMNQVYVSINDGTPVALIAQTADKFATADGNISTVFNQGPWQDDVTMSYVPNGMLASQRVVIGSAPLAAR